MKKPMMPTSEQVRAWVAHGGGSYPFCQSEAVRDVGTKRALDALASVEYHCQSCRNTHYAIFKGESLIDLTYDTVRFNVDE
jgi:hypothetical protein